jgi:hypothetical protein
MVWVCWPKKAAQKALSLASDLDDEHGARLGLELGFVDVKVAAVDETWSGLKFVRRLADRPSAGAAARAGVLEDADRAQQQGEQPQAHEQADHRADRRGRQRTHLPGVAARAERP